MIPVGGNYTLSAPEAVKVISQVEPKIVIPMHYRIPGSNMEVSPVEEFVREVGLEGMKLEEKLVVFAGKLPEERQVVILNSRSQNSAS
jgi:L-ascorbate metabolism protein UlaG (beta-lactamase superfamily)